MSHNLKHGRYGHSSWETDSGLYLIGGGYEEDISKTTELLTTGNQATEDGFALRYETW